MPRSQRRRTMAEAAAPSPLDHRATGLRSRARFRERFMEAVIEAEDLAKRYGAFEAVRGVSFAFPAGACLSLLGPNGPGKTTTMQMLMGLTLQNEVAGDHA